MSDHTSLKIPIMHRNNPYIYIRINNNDDHYRISMNYKYLNEHYNLKLKFIRDFSKIDNHDNKFFKIVDDIIYPKNIGYTQTITLGTDRNKCIIYRIIYEKTSIMIFKRMYEDSPENYSIFFASENISNINDIGE